MIRSSIIIPSIVVALSGAALAQSHSQYAGFESRSIKALSDQQIADLRAGRGMGLALAAELNGYPGPSHLLDLADQLGLSPAQRTRLEESFAAMTSEVKPIGERLIADEAALDRQFAARTVTQASLSEATEQIGKTQAKLRAAHLRYHLSTLDVLTPQQIDRYAELRGYRKAAQPGPRNHHP